MVSNLVVTTVTEGIIQRFRYPVFRYAESVSTASAHIRVYGVRDYRPVVIQDAFGFIEADHRAYTVEHADWLSGETTDRSDIEF